MNKKAAEILFWTLGVAVILVVAIVILVVFYDMETGNFSAFIREIRGAENVEDVAVLCNSLVSRKAPYEYCCAEKELRYETENGLKTEQITCQELSSRSIGSKIEKINCKGVC